MLRFFRDRRGQNTAEYAILIGLVVAAAIGMQTYVKRGLQAKAKDAGDGFYDKITGDTQWTAVSAKAVAPLTGKQFEDTKLSSKSTQAVSEDTETYTMEKDGSVDRGFIRRTTPEAGDFQKYEY